MWLLHLLTCCRDVLEPVLKRMIAREGFRGLTLQDIITVANAMELSYTPEPSDGTGNGSRKAV